MTIADVRDPDWLRKLADALRETDPPGIDYEGAIRAAADEIERLIAKIRDYEHCITWSGGLLTAIREQGERWKRYQAGAFYPEASAYANAIEHCGEVLIDMLDDAAQVES